MVEVSDAQKAEDYYQLWMKESRESSQFERQLEEEKRECSVLRNSVLRLQQRLIRRSQELLDARSEVLRLQSELLKEG